MLIGSVMTQDLIQSVMLLDFLVGCHSDNGLFGHTCKLVEYETKLGANKLKDNQLCAAIYVRIHTVPVP